MYIVEIKHKLNTVSMCVPFVRGLFYFTHCRLASMIFEISTNFASDLDTFVIGDPDQLPVYQWELPHGR